MLIATSIILLLLLLYIVLGTVIVCVIADKLDYADIDEKNILAAVAMWPILVLWYIYKTIVYSIAKLYETMYEKK